MNDTYAPETWGWKREHHAAWSAALESDRSARPLIPARVTGREHHSYEILCPDFSGRPDFAELPTAPGRYIDTRVSGRFEYTASGPADYPVTGDWVLVDPAENLSRIHAVLPRRSTLKRGRAGETSEEQVLAANIDTLLLVFALDGGRNFLPRMLERGLVVARNSGCAACVVLNKVDLASSEDQERALAEAAYSAPSVPVVAVSARTGEGVGELAAFFSPGETVGMLGKSGVGKSALVNALGAHRRDGSSPQEKTGPAGNTPLLAREGRVRDDDLRGRHTTTASRLYRLDSGILLIDSPGIRELKIWGDAEGLEGGFPEIAELARNCRFSDCSHSGEPGCAVQAALDSGDLAPERYLAYLDLAREQAWFERRHDERAQRENELKWKRIAKLQKTFKKEERS